MEVELRHERAGRPVNTEDIRGLYAFDQWANRRVIAAARLLPDEPWQLPLADLMYHVINHSSYHRGQVITLLRQLGHEPPATDFREFLKETAAMRG